MKLTIKENRELIMVNAKSTQNENDVEIIQIAVPERYSDFNKKIVFVTNDGTVWDFIEEDNTYKLKHSITKYRQVDFYIWLTKNEEDFRSVTKTLKFNHNKDANEEITDDEISGYNRMINILEDEITTVTGLETDLTNMINDIQNKLDAGYFKGKDGKTPKRGVDYWTNEDKEEIVQDVEEDIESILAEKVDKEEGKGLSSNDYTTAEKAKLSGIATGAEVNILENVKVNGTSKTIIDKTIDIAVPTKTSDLNNDSGFGTYSKPSGGIPKTDLATDVQTSLGKADTALQSHQDISGKEDKSNKVTELTNESTDTQYPSAKAVYDELESLKAENEDLQQQVEDLKNNQLTSSASGQSIDIDDSASAKNKSIGLTGNTTQESTTGKSKFDLKKLAETSSSYEPYYNGYTFLSANSMFNTGVTLDTPITLPVSCSYKIKNGTGKNLRLKFWFNNNTSLALDSYGSGSSTEEQEKTINNITKSGATSITKIGADWSIGGGFSIRDFIINEGSTAEPYEPYTGGQASPNPDYPQDINNTGDNVNLFDKDTISRDKSLTNGVETSTLSWYASDFIEVNANEKYFIYGPDKKAGKDNCFYDENKNYLSSISAITGELITPANAKYLRFNGRIAELTKVKLEKGSKATLYSPYGCGNVNEKVQNKNLALNDNPQNPDANYASSGSGSAPIQYNSNEDGYYTTTSRQRIFPVKNNETVTLSCYAKSNGSSNRIYLYRYNTETGEESYINNLFPSSSITNSYTQYSRTITMDGNYNAIKAVFYSNILWKDIQLEQGSTASPYQAHEEQTISFPLAQGQKFMQGDYLADDGVHHVMGEIVLNGNETWAYVSASIWKFQLYVKNLKFNDTGVNQYWFYSNYYKAQAGSENDYAIGQLSNVRNICIKDISKENFQDFRTWLEQRYANGNPVIIQYPLAEEVIDPYTEEQAEVWEQIKALRTYKPVTHISSEDETPATVNIEYVKDTTLAINEIIDEKIGNAIGGAY